MGWKGFLCCGRDLFSKWKSNINDAIWIKIVSRINKYLLGRAADGGIITADIWCREIEFIRQKGPRKRNPLPGPFDVEHYRNCALYL